MATNAQSIQFLLSQVRRAAGSLEDGTVTAYAAGTSNLKTIWLDRGKQTVAANPYTLDANGTAQLFGDGLYRFVIKSDSGVTVYDRDYISIRDAASLAYDAADYASLAAAVSAIGSTNATLQFGTDQTVTGNLTIPANIELVPTNGAKINHTTYTISYAGSSSRWPSTQIFNGTGAVSGIDVVRPEYFGAKANNSTDCWAAFLAVARSITASGGGTVKLSKGTYKVNQYKIQTAYQFDDDPAIINNDCFYRDCDGVHVIGYGAKIDLKGDVYLTPDYAGYKPDNRMAQVFTFQNCNRVRIEGLEIDGNADQLTRDPAATGETSGPLIGFQACRDSVITHCKLHHGWVEGVMVYKYEGPNPATPLDPKLTCRNVTIEHCEIYANGRNNVGGIEFRGLTIRNCRIYEGGRTGDPADVSWYSPGSNIDIEPDLIAPAIEETSGMTLIENCSLKNSRQTNITTAIRNTHLILRNCDIDNPGGNQQPVVVSTQYGVIEDCKLDMGTGRIDLAITGSQPGMNSVTVNRNEIRATNGEGLFIVGQLDGPNYMSDFDHARILSAMVSNNRFFNDSTEPMTKYFPVVSSGSSAVQITFRDNYIFIPAAAFDPANSPGEQTISNGMTANLCENNVWETDLDSTTDYFQVYYQPLSGASPRYNGVVRNERFFAPGADPKTRGIRPADDTTWNTDYAFGIGDSVRHLTKSTTIKTLTYGTTVDTNAALGSIFLIPITNGTAVTIANPTNPVTGQEIAYRLENTSGGAVGAVTWGSAFKTSATTGTPATGFTREIGFVFDGTYWRQRYTTGDVAN